MKKEDHLQNIFLGVACSLIGWSLPVCFLSDRQMVVIKGHYQIVIYKCIINAPADRLVTFVTRVHSFTGDNSASGKEV